MTVPTNDQVFSSWLEKKGDKRNNWNKRWCVLDDNCIEYFTSDKGTEKVKGRIPLDDAEVYATEGNKHRTHGFTIKTQISISGKEFNLRAPTEQEATEWIQNISSVIESDQKKYNDLELYTVEIFTGDKANAGIDGNVFLTLWGELGKTKRVPMIPPEGNIKKLFERNSVDIYTFLDKDIGKITHARLSHSGIGKVFKNWYVKKATVLKSCADKYLIPGDVWIKDQIVQEVQIIYEECTARRLEQGGTIVVGPILNFVGCESEKWKISALVGTKDSKKLGIIKWTIGKKTGKSDKPVKIYEFGTWALWRVFIKVPMAKTSEKCTYVLPDEKSTEFHFYVPPKNENPHIMCTSCNDLPHPENLKTTLDKNIMWVYLKKAYEVTPINLMILGGDQVYADPLWAATEEMRSFQFSENKFEVKITEKMSDEIEAFYFFLYLSRWSQPEMALMMARIPSLMMWDDHDIFDGWGSYPAERHDCQVYQAVFSGAKKAFFNFQMQADLKNVIAPKVSENGPFSKCLQIGKIGIVIPDIRSERELQVGPEKKSIVMKPESWNAIKNYISKIKKLDHLLFISTVPIVYPHSESVEKILDIMDHNLLDDVLDHWSSNIHREELNIVLDDLTEFSKSRNCRITVISGDVHVGSFGTIFNDKSMTEMIQLVSSGIVATAPPLIAQQGFEKMFSHSLTVGDHQFQVHRMPNGPNETQFVGAQNFVRLVPNEDSFEAIWTKKPNQNKYFKKGEMTELPEPKQYSVRIPRNPEQRSQ